MNLTNKTLIASAMALACATVTAGDMDNKSTTSTGSSTDSSAPVILLVPMVFAANDSLADGCWARLYDEENYSGNFLTLTGPMQISDADPHKVTGLEIGRNYDSLAVGPKATLSVYDNENFVDNSATYKGGQRVPDLDPKMGAFEEIKSMKVTFSSDSTAMTQ